MPAYHVVELQGLIPARWSFEMPTDEEAAKVFRAGYGNARRQGVSAVPAHFLKYRDDHLVDKISNGFRDQRRLYKIPMTE